MARWFAASVTKQTFEIHGSLAEAELPSYPWAMIAGIVASSRHAKMLRHIDIALLVDLPCFLDRLQAAMINLPWCPAVHTSHGIATLAGCPFIEATLVHVVPTCRLAPHKLIAIGLEVHVTYGTISLDGFASAVYILGAGRFCWYGWGAGEDLSKLGRDEGELILEMVGCFEDSVESIDFVFALVPFPVIRTGA